MSKLEIFAAVGTIIALSIGQVFFKLASASLTIGGNHLLTSAIHNPYLIIGLMIYAGATASWIFVLRTVPLSVAYPFAALAFLIVPILSKVFLHEKLTTGMIIGGIVIIIGIIITTK